MVRGLNAQLVQKLHPKTGKPIVPLGVVGGKVVWPIMGASPDDDSNGGDGGDNDDDNTDDGDSGADDSNNGDDDNSGDSGSGDDDTKAAMERLEKRMKAADQRAAKAEKALKDIEDAKKDDLTKANDRVTELETENGSLREQLNSLKLNNAFLASNKITWHNPTAALKLAQSEGYIADVVDEDGNVDEKGLGSALAKLAKEHEYLVKREGSGPSGEPHSTRSNNSKDDKVVKEQDNRRAPAMARRR